MPFIWFVGGVQEAYVPPPAKAIPQVEPVAAVSRVQRVGERRVARTVGAERAYRRSSPETRTRRREAVLIRDLMTTPVITIKPDARVSEARERMFDRRIRHLPVVSEEGRIVGILSDRDLLWTGGTNVDLTVRDVMIKKVLTATVETSLREGAGIMLKERIACVPVLDDSTRVVGILTTSDILRGVMNHAPLDLWI